MGWSLGIREVWRGERRHGLYGEQDGCTQCASRPSCVTVSRILSEKEVCVAVVSRPFICVVEVRAFAG